MYKQLFRCVVLTATFMTMPGFATIWPLDPLSLSEIDTASAAVRTDINFDADPSKWLFDKVELLEPTKAAMLAYKANPTTGNKPERKALVSVWNRQEDKYFDYVYNFDAASVASKKSKMLSASQKATLTANQLTKTRIHGAHPRLTFTEFGDAVGAIYNTPEFYTAMERRNLTEYEIANKISFDAPVDGRVRGKCGKSCATATPNWDTPTHKARMIHLTPYYDDAGPTTYSFSYYTQPIDQVTIFVDLNMTPPRVLVVDSAEDDDHVLPVMKGTFATEVNGDLCMFDRGARNTLGNLNTTNEPSFEIDGYKVNWENWSFRYAPHSRLGLVLYDVTYTDKHRSCTDETNANYCLGTLPPVTPEERSILYRASIDGVLSIYGDPDVPFVNHAFYDMSGDFPPVIFWSPQLPGIDCPEYATLLPGNFFDDAGNSFEAANFVALYEQDGGILWRHDETNFFGRSFARRGRELVLQFACTIGNYDFTYYYIFRQDGSIKVEVSLSGQMEFKQASVESLDHHDAVKAMHGGDDEFEYSPLVGPYVSAPNHSHFFNYRLDFDVDGTQNKVFEHDTVVDNNQCGTSWHTEEREITCGFSDYDIERNRMWVIENTDPAKKTCLGYHPGYAIVPQTMAVPMLKKCSRIINRATFLRHPLFVVPYKEGELESLGKYPVEASSDNSPADVPENKGLGWFLDNCNASPAEGYDAVVYYTMGHLHSPHPEQNPIMPVERVSFIIKPHAFFNENPSMDVDQGKFTSTTCP